MTGADHEAGPRPGSVYWALFVGLSTFSLSPILVRLAGDAPGMAVAVWRTVIAAAVLVPPAWIRSRREIAAFSRRDWMLIGGAGVFLGLHFTTWIESLYYTSVASASVLVTTSPIFLAILGYLFLRERLSVRLTVSIVFAVAGAALIGLGDVSGAGGESPVIGNGLAVTAALLVSLYLIVGRIVRRKTSWLAYVFPLYLVTAVTVLILALLTGAPLWGYPAEFYLLCAAMAIGPQVLGHGSFNFAVRYLPASILGLLSLVEPIGASILAYVLFDELPGVLAMCGIVVVLAAMALAAVRRPALRGAGHTD